MDKSQLPGALGWVASPSGSNQRLGSMGWKYGRQYENWKNFEEPFEVQFFNSSITSMYMGILGNAAKVWYGVRLYMHTRRKYKD